MCNLADAVVGKTEEGQRGFALHVTSHAILAARTFAGNCRTPAGSVAAEAASCVEGGFANQVLVRIMARGARERATYLIALARHQTDGLEADRQGVVDLRSF